MLTPEDAGRVLSVAPRTIYRRVEAGRVHYREVEGGGLLICLASLTAADAATVSRLDEPPMPG